MKKEQINQQKQIQYLDKEVDAVRQLPDVYIGALGNHGFLNMFREIAQNCLDEIIKGNTNIKDIRITVDTRDYKCIIEDSGQGIGLNDLAKVFSVLHSSSNYNKKEGSGEYSSGKNGMGATITNFLSKVFVVESYRMDGTAGKVEFYDGVMSPKGLQKIKCPKGKHGLVTSFQPADMMGVITVEYTELENLLWRMVNLCTHGTRVFFTAIDKMGQTHESVIENKRGIKDLYRGICQSSIFEPIYFTQDNGSMKVEILFGYDIKNMDDPYILGFANMCPTESGTHIDGFLDGVVKYFRDYMNKIYLANNKKLTVNAQDIRTGLRAVVSAFHIKPLFTGRFAAYHGNMVCYLF